MTVEEAARVATTGDLSDLVLLAELATEEVRDYKGGPRYLEREARRGPIDDALAAAIAADDHVVIVGTLDDVPVGFAGVHVVVLDSGTRIAELTEIYVMPEGRGVGVGEVMLEAVFDWARTQRCDAVEGQVHPGNRAAKNFFESAAMVTRLLRVSTPLD